MFKKFSDLGKSKPDSKDTKKGHGLELQKKLLSPKSANDTSSHMEHEQPVGVTKIGDSSEDPNILRSMREFIEQARPILQSSDKDLALSKNVLRDYERFRTRIEAGKITHSNPGNDQILIGDSDSHSNSQTITTDTLPISWDDVIQAYDNLQKLTEHNQKLKQEDTPVDQQSQEPHQEHTSGEGSQEHKLPDGITKIGDSYKIDVSIFNPAKIEALSQRDFALIDLRGIKGFKYDVSHFKTTHLQDIPKQDSPIRDNLDTVTALISDTLEDSHEYKTYLSSFDNYKCAFMHFYIFRVMQETGKVTHPDLSEHVKNAHHFLRELILDNQEQIVSTPVDQLAHEPSPERASGKMPTGITEKGDSYIIDASKFDLGTGDLSKLDPSREITYDTSKIDSTKFEHDFSSIKPEVIESMENFMTEAKEILSRSYKYEIYNVYPTIYERVLNDYYRFGIMSQIQKSDLSEEYLKLSIETADCFLTKLMEADIEVTKDSKGKNPDKSKKHNLYHPEVKLLFSKNKTERDIAEGLVITRAYIDLFHENDIKPSRKEDFDTLNLLAQEIVNTNIAEKSPEEHQDFLQYIRDINKNLRTIAEDSTGDSANNMPKDSTKDSTQEVISEDDLNPFQLALKKAIKATRDYDHWVQTWNREYANRFNLDEPSVKKGMEQRGIKKEDINESYKAFLANKKVLEAVNRGSINDRAYDYSALDALQSYEELTKANAKLKYMYDHLHQGIPFNSPPKHINGREVYYDTPGTHLRCLTYTLIAIGNPNLLKMDNPKLKWADVEKLAKPINDMLEKEGLVDQAEMLDLHSTQGQRLLELLVEQNLFDPSRGLWVYELDNNKMRWTEPIPRTETDPSKPRYAALHEIQKEHFNAMSESKQDVSTENAELGQSIKNDSEMQISKINKLIKRSDFYQKYHEEDLKDILKQKKLSWEDFNGLLDRARTLSQRNSQYLKGGDTATLIRSANELLGSIDTAMPKDLQVLAGEI